MFAKICPCLSKVKYLLDEIARPFSLLFLRFYVAADFFKSGMLKFNTYLNDDWSSTLFLFKEVHPVPFLPAEIAAPMAVIGELGLSILLMFGLAGRAAALGLLGMAMVIEFQFAYNDPSTVSLPEYLFSLLNALVHLNGGLITPAQYPQHLQWMLMLLVLVCCGVGKVSLDHVIGKCCRKRCMAKPDVTVTGGEKA